MQMSEFTFYLVSMRFLLHTFTLIYTNDETSQKWIVTFDIAEIKR